MGGKLAACAALALASATAHAEPLSAEDLARKNDGGYPTGLPLLAYSTDIGLGVGARAYYYWNGHPDDPRFKNTPYLYRIFLQGFVSTRGVQFHWLDFDAPKIFDSPYRVRSQLIYQRVLNSNYFGLGSKSLGKLQFPGSPTQYSSYDQYNTAQQQVQPDGTTWSKYDQYDLIRPTWIASLERLFDHDRVRVLGGLGFSYAKVNDYSGKQVDAVDAAGTATMATENTTRLAADCANHLVVGCNGGTDNYLRFAVSYDTRDFEPDPNTGVYLDSEVDIGTLALGSDYTYVRAMAAARGYWSPIADRADLVLAGRAVILGQTNGAPFFSMDTFPFTEDPRTGLGGHRTLRGFLQDRFVGSVMTLSNAEARWTFAHACLWKQKFAFIVVPFFDVGRPYDSLGELTFRDWQYSYGGALRISWNQATIATVDYGFSREGTGLYVNFNHIF